MKYSPALRPIHYAGVSGGKDSLFMFNLICSKPDKYPLDMVVHFELEIDYPFIKEVVGAIRTICETRGIKFVSIKPRKSYFDLLEKYGMPSRKTRWCNAQYKMDAKNN